MITRSRSKSKSPNPPQPQATSTVQRENTLKSRFDGKSHSGEEIGRQGLSYENESPERDNLVACNPNGIFGVSIKAQREASPKAYYGIDVNNKDFVAELKNEMAKCDKKFLSGSNIAEPVMNTEKQKMDFGSLSVESCSGKVSVSECFQRKSDNIGILGNNEKIKPNLGVISETAIKPDNLTPLVESTILTDAVLTDNERTLIPAYFDVDENSKILITNTQMCLVPPRLHSEVINIINTGNVAIHVSATVVPNEGHPNTTQDFSIKPDNLFLQVGERSFFSIEYKEYAKIKLVAGDNVYYHIIRTERKLEPEKENYLRCPSSDIYRSCSGKVSVSECFQRKSDNIGILGNNEKIKPNLGIISEIAIKPDNLTPLVESTILTDAVLTDNERTLIPAYFDVDENSKILITNTQMCLVPPRLHSEVINIINTGNVAIHVSATVVPNEGHPNTTQDFSIKPDNLFLQVGERSFSSIEYKEYAKIKLVAGDNVYYHIIRTERKLEPEKENYLRCPSSDNVVFVSPATSPQSVFSNRSVPISTLSTAAIGNTIPLEIKTSHIDVVWNSLKTGESKIKEFTIYNKSTNEIEIQLEICDDSRSFEFVINKTRACTRMHLTIQCHGSETLQIAFRPYSVGPVAGKITIKHYRESCDNQQDKKIPLYGYGGCSKVEIAGTLKNPSGQMYLSVGNLLYFKSTTLSTNMILNNIGDLCSFAKITVVPKAIYRKMDSRWHIHPDKIILNPNECQQVTITFHSEKEDFALLQGLGVGHMATLYVTAGDEPTRWRIRRLYKIKKSGESTENESGQEKWRMKEVKKIIRPICENFPGQELSLGLKSIRDHVDNLHDLCTSVYQYEIMLKVEAVHYDTDESEMCKSLMNDITEIHEADGASFFAPQTMTEYEVQHPELQGDQFTVTPSTILLNPLIQTEATVTVLSFSKTAEPFQTNLSNSDYFSVVPAEGMLPSKRSLPLKIQCSQRIERNTQAVLQIYTESNKQDVLIKVVVK